MEGLRVSVCGATGAVGQEIPALLASEGIPVGELNLFGSERSEGRQIETPYGTVEIQRFLRESVQAQSDLVFLCVGGDHSRDHAQALSDSGAMVIDNSSAFRYDPQVPLVVPGVNDEAVGAARLIANPNCTTAIGMMSLAPLHQEYGLTSVQMSTYQAASGAGAAGMAELENGMTSLVNGDQVENKAFAHPLAGNVIPHIDAFQENGYTKEEMKVVWETRKILGLPDDFPISCTAVRVPTFRSHAESIIAGTQSPVDLARLRSIWTTSPGLEVVDDPAENRYPMPLTSTGQKDVEVGRLRHNLVGGPRSVEYFTSGDQLLRGAALNAVQIAGLVSDRVLSQTR